MNDTGIYKTELKNINIKNIDIKLLCINNIDELFNNLLSEDADIDEVKDERIPYWAELWPSALALSEYLTESNYISSHTKVLELGCGLGLPGIVAGKLGATVTFTDYMQAPLDFAKKNWELNHTTSAKFNLLDWRNPEKIIADIILASDIAYESRSFGFIISVLEILCQPNTKIILSEPNRELAKPFLQKLKEHFTIEHHIKKVKLKQLESTVNILVLQKKTP